MKKAALDQLVRSVKGAVLSPASPGFAAASTIFNVVHATRPAAIVQCADDADVQTAVKFAREHELPLTTRGGGNAITGHSLVPGGLVIDLRARCEAFVQDGVLTAGGGATWGEVLVETVAHGVTTGAFDRRVGVGGFTLGAGFGATTRLLGLAPDTLVGADVVTAAGERLVASATEHPDLFWALRGAGANFGVVTRFRFRLSQVPPLVFGQLVFPLDDGAARVLRVYRDFVPGLPRETTVYGTVEVEPGRRELKFLVFHFGELADAERALAPLLELGPTTSGFDAVPYAAVHQENRGTFPANHGHAWRAHYFRALTDEVIDAVLAHLEQMNGFQEWVVFEHLGGAVGDLKPKDTAFAHRAAQFGFVTTLKWPAAQRKPARALELQESLHAKLRRHSLGSYVNYIPRDYTRTDVELAYGANLPRLRKLKAKYDPDNVFQQNINIRPAR